MSRKGHPTRISADVHDVVRRVGPGKRGVPAELYPAWERAVGRSIARVTRPDSLHHGVLSVATKNAVWVSELMMLQERILRGLQAELGEQFVQGVRFHVGKLFSREGHSDRSKPERPAEPLAPELRARLDSVRDPELRDVIERALSRCRAR